MTPMTSAESEMRVSELHSQHARWVTARARLWGGRPPKPIPPVARVTVEPLASWGAPINMLDLPSPRFLIRFAALRSGVRYGDVIGSTRAKEVVAARHEAIGLIWTHCRQMSLPSVGRLFDRDHTTILHALRKMRLSGEHYYRRMHTEAPNAH